MIIGAGFLQAFVIKKAKELGYYVICLDGNPNAVGFAFCDEYAAINIVDKEACLEYAKKAGIDGVLTAATDYGVLSASYISEKLGLPGIACSVAETIKNKYLVRKIIHESGADDTSESFQITEDFDLSEIMDRITFPVMVKPCDGSGSRGASKVSAPSDLSAACNEAIQSSLSKKALIEPFITGKEYGIESFVYNGEVNVLGVMKKSMTSPPYYAELGHSMPNDLSCETEQNAINCAKKAIKQLGITFGSVNMDVLITDSGKIHIVDIGARMGGNLIGSHIIPTGSGIAYIENMIKATVGDKADFSSSMSAKPVATRLLALTPGMVDTLPDFDKIESDYDVKIEHHLSAGDEIHEYHTNLDGMGYVVATADTMPEAENKAIAALRCIDESIIRK